MNRQVDPLHLGHLHIAHHRSTFSTCDDLSRNHTYDPGPDIPISERRMLPSAVLLWLCVASTTTAAEAFSPWSLPLALFRHISQLEGGSSWLSRLGWGLGEAEVSIVVSVRIVALHALQNLFHAAGSLFGYLRRFSRWPLPLACSENNPLLLVCRPGTAFSASSSFTSISRAISINSLNAVFVAFGTHWVAPSVAIPIHPCVLFLVAHDPR